MNMKMLQNLLLKLRKNSSIKIVITLLFPLSVFSFLLSYKYESFPSFFNQFNSILHFLNKKVMLFFFNAILLFVAKDSGLLTCSVEQPITAHRHGQDLPETQQPASAGEVVVEAKQVEKMKPALLEGEGSLEEEEVVEEMEELDIDELNKKFEEFIERFKMERKMEALQLVMV